MDNSVKPETLHAILEAQRRGRPLPRTPLHRLILKNSTSLNTIIHDVELIEWLVHHIITRLNHHRKHFGLKPASMTSSLNQSLHELSQDFQQNAAELEAWSMLYFYYVRVDLNLHWEALEAATAQSQRNLRRRRKHGLNRLLYDIIREKVLTV